MRTVKVRHDDGEIEERPENIDEFFARLCKGNALVGAMMPLFMIDALKKYAGFVASKSVDEVEQAMRGDAKPGEICTAPHGATWLLAAKELLRELEEAGF